MTGASRFLTGLVTHIARHDGIYWAIVMIMTRQLARYRAGAPPEARWGGDRPARRLQAQAA